MERDSKGIQKKYSQIEEQEKLESQISDTIEKTLDDKKQSLL